MALGSVNRFGISLMMLRLTIRGCESKALEGIVMNFGGGYSSRALKEPESARSGHLKVCLVDRRLRSRRVHM